LNKTKSTFSSSVRGTLTARLRLLADVSLRRIRHGIWTWDIALDAGHTAAYHSSAGNLLAPLSQAKSATRFFVEPVPAPCAGIGFYEPATGGTAQKS
jgi:hypothetical protein